MKDSYQMPEFLCEEVPFEQGFVFSTPGGSEGTGEDLW